MSYPERGKMDENRTVYTHDDGTVHELVPDCGCSECSLDELDCQALRFANCGSGSFRLIQGAYVPTESERVSSLEREACDMARAMITKCQDNRYWSGPLVRRPCENKDNHYLDCAEFNHRSCPARAFLATHGDATAWEAKL